MLRKHEKGDGSSLCRRIRRIWLLIHGGTTTVGAVGGGLGWLCGYLRVNV